MDRAACGSAGVRPRERLQHRAVMPVSECVSAHVRAWQFTQRGKHKEAGFLLGVAHKRVSTGCCLSTRLSSGALHTNMKNNCFLFYILSFIYLVFFFRQFEQCSVRFAFLVVRNGDFNHDGLAGFSSDRF